MTAAACAKVMPVSVYHGPCVCSAVQCGMHCPQVQGICLGRTLLMARQQHMHIGTVDASAWAVSGQEECGSARTLKSRVFSWVSALLLALKQCQAMDSCAVRVASAFLGTFLVWCPKSCAKRVSQRARCMGGHTCTLATQSASGLIYTYIYVSCAVCCVCCVCCAVYLCTV